MTINTSKVNFKPEGYNTVTPYLVIKGAAKAIEYYKNVFGATVVVRMDGPDGKVGHAELQIGDSRIMLADENPAMGNRSAESIGGSPVSLYLYLPDCDKVVAKAAAEGAKILKPVRTTTSSSRPKMNCTRGSACQRSRCSVCEKSVSPRSSTLPKPPRKQTAKARFTSAAAPSCDGRLPGRLRTIVPRRAPRRAEIG